MKGTSTLDDRERGRDRKTKIGTVLEEIPPSPAYLIRAVWFRATQVGAHQCYVGIYNCFDSVACPVSLLCLTIEASLQLAGEG